MEPKRRRELAMGGIAIAVAALVAFRISSSSDTPPASAATPRTGSQRQSANPTISQVPQVDIDSLKAARPEPADASRDPFRFRPKPAPPSSQSSTPRVTVPPVATGPVEPPAPPRIPLKFIGILESHKTGLVAILSDGRSAPMSGKQGDVIDGRYQILRIGVESIDLAYLDGRGRQTIRFTGQ